MGTSGNSGDAGCVISDKNKTAISGHTRAAHQEPFERVTPVLMAALLLGTGGGFVLACILTLTSMLHLVTGPWWTSVVQAHGHLQLYGWAGLFVIGVAFHFLPRLRGIPLAFPRLVPWILGCQVTGLVLRAFSQPLVTTTGADIYRVALGVSGVLEGIALPGAAWILIVTIIRGPSLAQRAAFRGVLPLIVGAFAALGFASIVNLINVVIAAASSGIIINTYDDLNVTLGLFGFLVPMALAMSAQSLPLYAGLDTFPRRILWPLAGTYMAGLILLCSSILANRQAAALPGMLDGSGMLLIGMVLLIFIGVFLNLMRKRGRLPRRVAELAPKREALASSYRAKVSIERSAFGPFVELIASAYIWAILASLLLVIDGGLLLLGGEPLFAIDAIRHSLTVGFITLLICGIAPRMITGFSRGKIVSPHLVTITLWLGNIAALLRVGSVLFLPLLSSLSTGGFSLYSILFGLSGPAGLALSACLTINLWPALKPAKPRAG